MRVTRVLLIHNKIREFKYQWLKHGKHRVVRDTGDAEYLKELGIKVYEPKEIASDLNVTKTLQPVIGKHPDPIPSLPELYSFTNDFKPVLGVGLELIQNLTWSVAKEELPENVLDKKRSLVPEDRRLVEQDIVSAHLFDCRDVRIRDPRNFELPNKQERDDHIYRPSVLRKNESLTSFLSQTFDRTSDDPLKYMTRLSLKNINNSCIYKYKDDTIHSLLNPHRLVTAKPLPPVLDPSEANLFIRKKHDEHTVRMIERKLIAEELGTDLQQPIPHAGPVEPYLAAEVLDQYEDRRSYYALGSSSLSSAPHTLHIHDNSERLDNQEHQITALSLLHLHTVALSYAMHMQLKVNSEGHLENPVVVQAIHSHLNMFQGCVFQLNTIGPHLTPMQSLSVGPKKSVSTTPYPHLAHLTPFRERGGENVRNMFFHTPFQQLYQECKYEVARPTLTGVQDGVVETLRALHEV